MGDNEIKELVAKARANDQKAFQQLVENYQAMVYSLAYRLLCNADDAKDIVQETFFKVWKNLGKYNDAMKFSTWLYRIASNQCYDTLKSTKYRNNRFMGDVHSAAVLSKAKNENLETKIIQDDIIKLIRYLTEKLSPKQKLVFTLSELDGLAVDEIVEITGLSPIKIKNNLYLARKQVRAQLEIIDRDHENDKNNTHEK